MYIPVWGVVLLAVIFWTIAIVDGYSTYRARKIIKKQHEYANEAWGALGILVNAVNERNPEIFEEPEVEKMVIDLRAKHLLDEEGLE